jgi:hypothetical protein
MMQFLIDSGSDVNARAVSHVVHPLFGLSRHDHML